MFAVAGLVVSSANAGVLTNADFEDDLALVPNPGDTSTAAPTGWEYDRYYGYDVDPLLMNVSGIRSRFLIDELMLRMSRNQSSRKSRKNRPR